MDSDRRQEQGDLGAVSCSESGDTNDVREIVRDEQVKGCKKDGAFGSEKLNI